MPKLKQVWLWSFGLTKTFQELNRMDGKRTPLDGRQLKRFIASMREVVDFYKKLRNSSEKTNKR